MHASYNHTLYISTDPSTAATTSLNKEEESESDQEVPTNLNMSSVVKAVSEHKGEYLLLLPSV